MISRTLLKPDGTTWRLALAADVSTLEQETALFQRGILPAAGWLALAVIVAAVLVLRAALRPFVRLRETVRQVTTSEDSEIKESFPSEVAPLVADLNAMLDKNARLRARGRAQAANLAHALKAPAAVLQNEIDRVRGGGELDIEMAQGAIDRIDNAAQRHVSRAGAGAGDRPKDQRHDALEPLYGVVRAIGTLFPDLEVEISAPERFDLALDPADQQEIFGNLLENAGKWARSLTRVSLRQTGDAATIIVEDDGAGVPEEERARILPQGVRLDETKAGAGLGLGIVEEIVDRHDGTLELGTSDLGGLLVRISFPARSGN